MRYMKETTPAHPGCSHFLRRHYPDQVKGPGAAVGSTSQPEMPSSAPVNIPLRCGAPILPWNGAAVKRMGGTARVSSKLCEPSAHPTKFWRNFVGCAETPRKCAQWQRIRGKSAKYTLCTGGEGETIRTDWGLTGGQIRCRITL